VALASWVATVSAVVSSRGSTLCRTPFAIEVRTHGEAIAIAPKQKTVGLRNIATGPRVRTAKE